jgi:hypothetical protein
MDKSNLDGIGLDAPGGALFTFPNDGGDCFVHLDGFYITSAEEPRCARPGPALGGDEDPSTPLASSLPASEGGQVTLGAVLALLLYALVSVLRARHRYLEWHRFWCPQREALKALRRIG